MTDSDFIWIRKRNRRIWRYAVLSAILLATVFLLTGCVQSLFDPLQGDNRKAYDLMVKTSDYFEYPRTVRIVSGEIHNDELYCVIKAKNRYGYMVSDSYKVSKNGYPSDSYSSWCKSKELDYDLINESLEEYFYPSSTKSTEKKTNGGIDMTSGGLILLYFFLIIIALCLNGLLASKASDIAAEKGYNKGTWFHMCFWLMPLSYVIVAAMPDKEMRNKQDETNMLLRQVLKAQNIAVEETNAETSDDVSDYLPEI